MSVKPLPGHRAFVAKRNAFCVYGVCNLDERLVQGGFFEMLLICGETLPAPSSAVIMRSFKFVNDGQSRPDITSWKNVGNKIIRGNDSNVATKFVGNLVLNIASRHPVFRLESTADFNGRVIQNGQRRHWNWRLTRVDS